MLVIQGSTTNELASHCYSFENYFYFSNKKYLRKEVTASIISRERWTSIESNLMASLKLKNDYEEEVLIMSQPGSKSGGCSLGKF